MHESATPEHLWLQRLAGEWTFESTCSMGPGQPPLIPRGTDRVRSLGELWVICEAEASMADGTPMRSVITLGFDPRTRRFVGSFIASAMSMQWIYEGELSADGARLTLDTEGPDFEKEGAVSRYQDIIELLPDGRRVLRSTVRGADGAWTEFLRGTYTRVG